MIQAALVNARVVRPKVVETTALGAGMLAALGAGVISSKDEIAGRLRRLVVNANVLTDG